MKIHNLELISLCSEKHSNSKEALRAWLAIAKAASWKAPMDIKTRFSSASFLPGNRVVFNVAGNNFRLIAVINYSYGIIEIRFVDTHAAYDKINAEKI